MLLVLSFLRHVYRIVYGEISYQRRPMHGYHVCVGHEHAYVVQVAQPDATLDINGFWNGIQNHATNDCISFPFLKRPFHFL